VFSFVMSYNFNALNIFNLVEKENLKGEFVLIVQNK